MISTSLPRGDNLYFVTLGQWRRLSGARCDKMAVHRSRHDGVGIIERGERFGERRRAELKLGAVDDDLHGTPWRRAKRCRPPAERRPAKAESRDGRSR